MRVGYHACVALDGFDPLTLRAAAADGHQVEELMAR
jgi:hypothetical protein